MILTKDVTGISSQEISIQTDVTDCDIFDIQFLEMIPYAATIIALMVFGMLRMNRQRKIEKGSQK